MSYSPKICSSYIWLIKIAANYLKTGKFSIRQGQLEKLGIRLYTDSDVNSLNIQKIALDGARKSAKSLSFYIMYGFLLLFTPKEKRVSITVYAWYYKNAQECFQEFLKRMKVDFGIDFNERPYSKYARKKDLVIYFKWTYWDKAKKQNVEIDNQIRFSAMFELQKVAKLGTTRSSDFHAEIIFFEEYSKIAEERYVEDIRQAHGGTQEYLECFSSNPWTIKHFLIGFFHKLMPYDERWVKKYYYQLGIKDDMVIWHCQWRVNNMLKPPDIAKQEALEKYNPNLAKVACFGMPGIEQGGILSAWCNLVQYINFKDEEEMYNWDSKFQFGDSYYQLGMDFATKQDKSVLQLVRLCGKKEINGEEIFEKVVVVKEWFWNPISMGEDYSYRADDMAQFIWKQVIMKWYEKCPEFKKQIDYDGLIICIDTTAHNMISAMNKVILNYQYFVDKVLVQPSLRFNYRSLGNSKHYSKDRMKIEEFRRLLEEDAFYICKTNNYSNAPLLEQNMVSWEYKKSIQGVEKDVPSDYNCDAIDAFIYSICDRFGMIGKYYNKD